jgi:hypothetical protein
MPPVRGAGGIGDATCGARPEQCAIVSRTMIRHQNDDRQSEG